MLDGSPGMPCVAEPPNSLNTCARAGLLRHSAARRLSAYLLWLTVNTTHAHVQHNVNARIWCRQPAKLMTQSVHVLLYAFPGK